MFYPFFFFFILLIPFSFQHYREEMNTIMSRHAMDNLFILPILTAKDILTQDECSMKNVMKCILESFSEDSNCFSNIFNQRLSKNLSKSDATDIKYTESSFLSSLTKCSIKEIKKIEFKYTALSRQTHLYGGYLNLQKSAYPKCVENISRCFEGRKCIIPFQYNIIDKIISICSEESFKSLNLNFLPTTVPKSYVDEIEEMKTKKIGNIYDTSITSKFSTKPIPIFENSITYEEFDALKMISVTIPILKEYFCDSRINENYFETIESYIAFTESPQLPEKIIHLFKGFTPDQYKSLRLMLKLEPNLYWSFCSTIFAISPSKELSNIFSQPLTLWTLQNCRAMADSNIMTHSAICTGPGLIFGKN